MELISVIMPVYNAEKYVEEAISSVIDQTYKNLQIIIINDGSTDNSEETIKNVNDPRIEYYKISHGGVSKAANFGIKKAIGQYIIRMDSDDISDLNRIKIQYEFIKNNPQFDIIGSNYKLLNEKGKYLKKVKLPETYKEIKNILPRNCCLTQGSLIINKRIKDIFHYNENLSTVEDWELFLRLIEKVKFYTIQNYLLSVRQRKFSLTKNNLEFSLNNEIVCREFYQKIISGNYSRKRKSKAYFDLGYFYYYENRFKEAATYFKKALKDDSQNIQYLRYYLFANHLPFLVKLNRKSNLFKSYSFLHKIDKRGYFLRS